jgi:phospho-N-acetylmuramoyl-pentapeptide-transferase
MRDLKLNLAIGGGSLFIFFATLVIIGSSNAVNLTDGLDGLAIGCTIIVSTTLTIISYIVGRKDFAEYLNVTYIAGAGELSICCFALVGAGLAYLWFNGFPASVFMGDCGSLMLGGFLGYVAVALRQEILLGIIGGIFVLEAVSVMIQVFWFKLTRKRVFRCAPIHHHFVLNGMPESKVVIRFWIIEIFLALFALATLQLR